MHALVACVGLSANLSRHYLRNRVASLWESGLGWDRVVSNNKIFSIYEFVIEMNIFVSIKI